MKMSPQAYDNAIEACYESITACIDSVDEDIDLEEQQGILTLIFPGQQTVVFSRQPALSELWLASPSGAYHFKYTGFDWQTAQQQTLTTVFAELTQAYLGVSLNLTPFLNQDED